MRNDYWLTPTHRGGARTGRWSHMDHAYVVTDPAIIDATIAMYDRYVVRWNSVECDQSKPLDLHDRDILGAQIVGSNNVVLSHDDWLLVIYVSKRWRHFGEGWSTRKNPIVRKYIFEIQVHFKDDKEVYEKWLVMERMRFVPDNVYDSLMKVK